MLYAEELPNKTLLINFKFLMSRKTLNCYRLRFGGSYNSHLTRFNTTINSLD